MEEKLLECFMKLQNKNQTKFTKNKSKEKIRRKGYKLCIKWKTYDNSFNSWIDKKVASYKMSYFPEPYSRSKNKINRIRFV